MERIIEITTSETNWQPLFPFIASLQWLNLVKKIPQYYTEAVLSNYFHSIRPPQRPHWLIFLLITPSTEAVLINFFTHYTLHRGRIEYFFYSLPPQQRPYWVIYFTYYILYRGRIKWFISFVTLSIEAALLIFSFSSQSLREDVMINVFHFIHPLSRTYQSL